MRKYNALLRRAATVFALALALSPAALGEPMTADAASAVDVQQRLIDYGYLQGRADGIIGPRSKSALKLFQRVQGLKATGKADETTLEALFSDQAICLPAALSSGSKGEAVEKLQRRLIQYGFMEGKADGSYGKSTVSAVRAFQRHLQAQGYEEFEADGAASPLTQYCLYSDRYSSFLSTPALGDRSDEVLRVERRLKSLGYLDGNADDILDDYALSALSLFREHAGLSAGTIDREAVDALFSATAPAAQYCAPHDVAAGDSGLAVKALEQALISGGLLSRLPSGKYDKGVEDAIGRLYKSLSAAGDARAELFSDPKALSAEALQRLQEGLLTRRMDRESSQSEVRRIQSRLYTLYYLPASGIDGKLGRDTRKAIEAFQSANGMFVTGETDDATLRMLFSADAVAKPYRYRVEVSIADQTVEIYELWKGSTYSLAQSFTCSTGLHDATPRGIFLEGRPADRWHHFEKFDCWAQYAYVITDDIMFHSVIYSADNENSLRRNSLYALGSPASHGCVRLTVEDSKWLYEHCKRGETVIVIY